VVRRHPIQEISQQQVVEVVRLALETSDFRGKGQATWGGGGSASSLKNQGPVQPEKRAENPSSVRMGRRGRTTKFPPGLKTRGCLGDFLWRLARGSRCSRGKTTTSGVNHVRSGSNVLGKTNMARSDFNQAFDDSFTRGDRSSLKKDKEV